MVQTDEITTMRVSAKDAENISIWMGKGRLRPGVGPVSEPCIMWIERTDKTGRFAKTGDIIARMDDGSFGVFRELPALPFEEARVLPV